MAGCKKRFSLGIIISLLFLSLFSSANFGLVSADDVTVTFSGITNPSITHKAHYYLNTGATAWGNSGTETPSNSYSKWGTLDSNYSTNSATGNGYFFLRFDFNLSYVMRVNSISLADIESIYLRYDGYGTRIYAGNYALNGAVYNSNAGTWQTSDATGATGVWSHTSSGIDDLYLTISEANVSDFTDIGTYYGLRYCVRTAYDDGAEKRIYTDRIYIKITYTPPLTSPTLVSPSNGGTGYGITPNFDWNVSTGGTSPYTHEIMVADNLGFTTPDVNVTGLSDSNYSYTTGLTPNTTYYWKVRTKDNGGAYSSWATTQSFTTASFTAPTISAPVNGVETSDTTPTITYSASTGGSGTYTYEVQIDDSSEFGSPAVDITGQTSTSYTPTTELSLIRYYARVRAKDSLNNYSAWSSPISFTVIASSSGGSGSASTMESTSTDPTINQSTIVEDTPAVTTSSGSTNIITKYIITPVQTIVINPMKNFFVWVWESLTGLIRGSNQEEIYLPVVGEITMSGLLILIGLGIAVWILLFGSPIKKKDVKKIGRTANKNVRKIRGMI